MHFKVSTVLPMPAAEFFLERDSAAFRSLVARRFAPTLLWNPLVSRERVHSAAWW